MSTITWLHLSDLHLCPPETGWNATRILNTLREDLKGFQDQGIQPDLLFFTGDAAFGQLNDGDLSIEEQFTSALLFLEEVRNLFSPPVPSDRVFIVPGNHDVNLQTVDETTTEWLSNRRKEGKKGRERIEKAIKEIDSEWKRIIERLSEYRSALKEAGYDHLLQDPDRLIYSQNISVGDVDLGIAGFNSAWSCQGAGYEAKGDLWLAGHWQLETLRQNIENADVRVALMHHPFNWMLDREDQPDLKSLFRGDFDFFLHGHEHRSWVQQLDNHIQISADACYDSPRSTNNGYNIVELDTENNEVSIHLRKYEQKGGGGWVYRPIPNKAPDGIWKIDIPWIRSDEEEKRGNALIYEKYNNSEDNKESKLTGPESRGVFGRSSEIDQLSRIIYDNHLTIIYGLSGIGKSTLVQEARRSDRLQEYNYKGPYPQYYNEDLSEVQKLEDLYRLIVRLLGSRDEDPSPPSPFFGRPRDYRGVLSEFSQRDGPALIHLTQAHQLFTKDGVANEEISHFFSSIAEHCPKARIVLESEETPPSISESNARVVYESFKIKGIEKRGLKAYLMDRSPNKSDTEWELTSEVIGYIYDRLGGSDEREGAHPLAMELVADLAVDYSTTPSEVLNRHEDKLTEDLNRALLGEIYESVLSSSQRHLLRICSLYRTAIPESHVPELQEEVGDHETFSHLERRCLFTSFSKQERHILHPLIGKLVRERLDAEGEEFKADHEQIGHCWLEKAKSLRKQNLSGIESATEAAHHLLKAERFDKLAELHDRYVKKDILPELDQYATELYDKGNREDEKRVRELIVAIDPGDHKSHRFLGQILEKENGKGDENALRHYEKAYDMWKSNGTYLNKLGSCLRARSESRNLVEMVNRLDEKTKQEVFKNDHFVHTYTLALEDVGKKDEAKEIQSKKIREGTQNDAFYVEKANRLVIEGSPAKALKVTWEAMMSLESKDPYLFSVRAKALEKLGKGGQASKIRQSLISKNVKNTAIYTDEANYQVKKENPGESLRILSLKEERNLKEGKKNRNVSTVVKAKALKAQGRLENARSLLQDAIDSGLDSNRTQLLLGEIKRMIE
jgi:tetratricopeptide (TPR) repeat protein